MSDSIGTDISTSSTGDWVATPQADVAVVSGTDNLQQALERRWKTRKGALFYAPNYGNSVFDMMSEPITPDWMDKATIAARECLLGDQRVADVQVTITPIPEQRTIQFQCLWTDVNDNTGQLQKVVTVSV